MAELLNAGNGAEGEEQPVYVQKERGTLCIAIALTWHT